MWHCPSALRSCFIVKLHVHNVSVLCSKLVCPHPSSLLSHVYHLSLPPLLSPPSSPLPSLPSCPLPLLPSPPSPPVPSLFSCPLPPLLSPPSPPVPSLPSCPLPLLLSPPSPPLPPLLSPPSPPLLRLFHVEEGYSSKLKRDDLKHTIGLDVHSEEVAKAVPTLSNSVYGHPVLRHLETPDRKYVRVATVNKEFYRSCGANVTFQWIWNIYMYVLHFIYTLSSTNCIICTFCYTVQTA